VSDDALLPAERKILEELGHLPLDFRAMWAISNVFRSSTALRRHLEATVLAPDRLSWTAFTALWVLWIWGEIESREFASAVGISRPTATGVLATLHRRRLVRRRKATKDGRVVLVSLTPSGRRKIEDQPGGGQVGVPADFDGAGGPGVDAPLAPAWGGYRRGPGGSAGG
jgi:DNA-binding MarR family transcriptional regulator